MTMNGWVSSECGNLAANTASTLAANQHFHEKNHYDWLFPRIYARRNIALKSCVTILHCLANEVYLELLG